MPARAPAGRCRETGSPPTLRARCQLSLARHQLCLLFGLAALHSSRCRWAPPTTWHRRCGAASPTHTPQVGRVLHNPTCMNQPGVCCANPSQSARQAALPRAHAQQGLRQTHSRRQLVESACLPACHLPACHLPACRHLGPGLRAARAVHPQAPLHWRQRCRGQAEGELQEGASSRGASI